MECNLVKHGMSVMNNVDVVARPGSDGRFHYTYLIICTTNPLGKRYIGKHSAKNINDNYSGSGVALKEAWGVYGKKNFKRINLNFYDTSEAAFSAEEKSLRECKLGVDYYNLIPGGGVGFSDATRAAALTPESRAKAAASMVATFSAYTPDEKDALTNSQQAWREDAGKVARALAKSSAAQIGRTVETHEYLKEKAGRARGRKRSPEATAKWLITLGGVSGYNNPNAKLSKEDHEEIISLFNSGKTRKELFVMFSHKILSPDPIRAIIRKAIKDGRIPQTEITSK